MRMQTKLPRCGGHVFCRTMPIFSQCRRFHCAALAAFLSLSVGVAATMPVNAADPQAGSLSTTSFSPVEIQGRREFFLVTVGLMANVGANYLLLEQKDVDPGAFDRSRLWAMDRWNAGTYRPGISLASDILVMPLTLALPLADAVMFVSGRAGMLPVAEDALVLGEALAWSTALGLTVRSLRWHPRPLVFSDAAPMRERTKPDAGGSFYSGHTNAAFVGISTLATLLPARYPGLSRAWLWTAGGTAAAGIGVMRILAGKHYPTDVLAGAVMGSLFGWAFAEWHLRRTSNHHPGQAGGDAGVSVLPSLSGFPVLVYRF